MKRLFLDMDEYPETHYAAYPRSRRALIVNVSAPRPKGEHGILCLRIMQETPKQLPGDFWEQVEGWSMILKAYRGRNA